MPPTGKNGNGRKPGGNGARKIPASVRELPRITVRSDTRDILAHAAKDAKKLRDYFIVDVDAHVTEVAFWNEITDLIDSDVYRHWAQSFRDRANMFWYHCGNRGALVGGLDARAGRVAGRARHGLDTRAGGHVPLARTRPAHALSGRDGAARARGCRSARTQCARDRRGYRCARGGAQASAIENENPGAQIAPEPNTAPALGAARSP